MNGTNKDSTGKYKAQAVGEGLVIANKVKFAGPEESWHKANTLEGW